MSNPILQSNESSAVVATVLSSTTKNPWVYNEKERLTTPHALQVLPVATKYGTVAANRTIGFELPKNGIATGFWLQLSVDDAFTTSPAHTVNNFNAHGILDCIESITLNTSGRVIERLDKFQILARYKCLPRTRQIAVAEELMMDFRFDTQVREAHVWIPFYMFRDPNRYGIMTNFEEPHHVEVEFSDLRCAMTEPSATQTGNEYVFHPSGHDKAGQLKLAGAKLLVHYRQVDEKTMNSIVSANFADGMLSRLIGVSQREPVTSFSGGQTTTPVEKTIELKENQAVRALYVCVASDTYQDHSTGEDNRVSKMLAKILNVKLTFNNTDVIDCPAHFINTFASNWDMMTSGQEVHETSNSRDSSLKRMLRIDLGHGDDTDLSNVVAFRELSNATLTLKYLQNGNFEHAVHVIYETATFLTTSASTGRVQLSISS